MWGFALTPHARLEAKLCIFFTVLPSSLNFRACPWLVVGGGGVCFCKLKIKFMSTLFKCVGGLISTEDSWMLLSTESFRGSILNF